MKCKPSFILSARQLLTIGLTLCLGIYLGHAARADDWTTYQHDAAHTGRSSANFDPTLLKKVWGLSAGNTQPIVVGNNLYELTGSGDPIHPIRLNSYNLPTGQKNWSADFARGGG